jgi:hypothetical protein
MAWSAQWRTKGNFSDNVLLLDESGRVREALAADQPVLSRLLTTMGDLQNWQGAQNVGMDETDPEAWGQLVISRAGSGEVIEVEPELFWQGIYSWFRSRGIDYDTPGLTRSYPMDDAPRLPRAQLMDD